jgi:hypothetical protein
MQVSLIKLVSGFLTVSPMWLEAQQRQVALPATTNASSEKIARAGKRTH